MRFRVRHTTEYRYSAPVFLEPHTIRLRPRSDPVQREFDFKLAIDPEPARLSWALDPEGNSVAYAWFEELAERLTIVAEAEAENTRTNPFDFLWLDGAERLGFQYRDERALERFMTPPAERQRFALAGQAMAESEGDTAKFLLSLTKLVHEAFTIIVRDEGDPYSPEELLQRGEGACRDLAVLFMACCREVGLAARFVSGYQAGDPDTDERHLHAWAGVYLPGGGWRGFDPTLGLVVADEHVTLAVAPDPAGAAPVVGHFRGTGATATMHADLELEAC